MAPDRRAIVEPAPEGAVKSYGPDYDYGSRLSAAWLDRGDRLR